MPSKKQALETRLETKCVDFATLHGWMSFKLDKIPGERGKPDRVFLGPAGTYFLTEFKRLGKRAEPLQEHRHEAFAAIGSPVLLADSFELFEARFAHFEHLARRRQVLRR